MDLDSDLRPEIQFLRFYGATLLNRNRGPRLRYNKFFYDPADADTIVDARDISENERDYENTIVIEIGESALQELMHLHEMYYYRVEHGAKIFARDLLEKLIEEKKLRDKYPSVQQAWEQYSLMLHLSSNGKADD